MILSCGFLIKTIFLSKYLTSFKGVSNSGLSLHQQTVILVKKLQKNYLLTLCWLTKIVDVIWLVWQIHCRCIRLETHFYTNDHYPHPHVVFATHFSLTRIYCVFPNDKKTRHTWLSLNALESRTAHFTKWWQAMFTLKHTP